MKTLNSKYQFDPQSQTSQSMMTKLQKLRLQIYKPYKSALKTQHSPQQYQNDNLQTELRASGSSTIQKKHSLQLKYKKKNLDGIDNMFKKRKTVKLPSIMKKKSTYTHLTNQSTMPMTIADFVPDPLLNGRIRSMRQKVYQNIQINSNQYLFLKKVQQQQLQFLQNCHNKRYTQSQQILVCLLNYSIDLNLIDQLCFTLKIIADFNFESLQIQKAFFYYNEGRKCALFTGQFQLMVQCLIKLALCASRSGLLNQSIRILKKALQYAWYYDLVNLQCRVYDQIGKNYYVMGDAEKAKHFHYKFFTGKTQLKNSSIRLLSYQSLVLEGLKQMKIHRSISSVFLWMIQIPVKNCDSLSQFLTEQKTQENENQRTSSPRKGYNKDMKYFSQFRTVNQAIIKLFQQDFFKNQLGQMHLNSEDWTNPLRKKKFLSLDIQRNNYLKALGIEFKDYLNKTKKPLNIKLKQSIEKTRKIKTQVDEDEPKQEQIIKNTLKQTQQWFAMMTAEAIKKYRYRNQQVSNKVNLRGMDKHSEGKTAVFRIIYNQYFDFTAKYKTHQLALIN